MMRLCITGCSRSGTGWIAEFCRRSGLDIGHEKVRADGVAGWMWTMPEIEARSEFGLILHQVREPLATIGSTMTHRAKVWEHVEKVIGPLPKDNALLRSAFYWIRWNIVSEALASWTYRVEEIRPGTATMSEWSARTGIVIPSPFPDVPRNLNARRHPCVRPSDFAEYPETWQQIRALSARYGYSIEVTQ